MRIVATCEEPGCSTLGAGRLCIKHEPKVTRVFVRGRPWPPVGSDDQVPVIKVDGLMRGSTLLPPAVLAVTDSRP